MLRDAGIRTLVKYGRGTDILFTRLLIVGFAVPVVM